MDFRYGTGYIMCISTNLSGEVMKGKNSRRLSVLLILFSLLYNSCTLVGLGLGRVKDRLTPGYKQIDPIEVRTLKPGNTLVIYLSDSSALIGDIVGFSDAIQIAEPNQAYRTKIIISSTHFGERVIDLDDIEFVEIKVKKRGWLMGAKIGASLDLALFVLLLLVAATVPV